MERARRSMESRINVVDGQGRGVSGVDTTATNSPESTSSQAHRGNTGFMELVGKVWHWHAVEWGGRCKFLYNGLLSECLLTILV